MLNVDIGLSKETGEKSFVFSTVYTLWSQYYISSYVIYFVYNMIQVITVLTDFLTESMRSPSSMAPRHMIHQRHIPKESASKVVVD